MKIETFNQIVDEINKKRVGLMQVKTHDYDADIDRLASFKQVAEICKILNVNCYTGSGVSTLLFVLKMVRDANLKESGKTPSNESRIDTIYDEHNYIDLKYANEIDESDVKSKI